MATKTVFSDTDNNELECYINDHGKIYIGVSQAGDDNIYSGYITLEKNDLTRLIKILSELQEEMKD